MRDLRSVAILLCLSIMAGLLATSATAQSENVPKNGTMSLRVEASLRSAKFNYWFEAPDATKSAKAAMPAVKTDGLIQIPVPAKYSVTGSVLNIQFPKRKKIARIRVTTNDTPNDAAKEPEGLGPTILRNGYFTQGKDIWEVHNVDGANLELVSLGEPPQEVSGKSVILRINEAGKHNWHATFTQPGLDLEEGENYTVIFWGKADQDIPMMVFSQHEKDDFRPFGLNHPANLTTEWKKHIISFKARNVEPKFARLSFLLGLKKGTIELAGIRLQKGTPRPQKQPNLLRNADFALGGDSWSKLQIANSAKADMQFIDRETLPPPTGVSGKVVRFNIYQTGQNPWDVCFSQNERDLLDGEVYTISFWAKASKDRNLTVRITRMDTGSGNAGNGQNPPQSLGLLTQVRLNENWKQYQLAFVAEDTTRDTSQLAFDLGDAQGTVDIADVALRLGRAADVSPSKDLVYDRAVRLLNSDFTIAEEVIVPLVVRGRAAKDVTITLDIGGVSYGFYRLTARDMGKARFTNIPTQREMNFLVTNGEKKAKYTRILPLTDSNTLTAISLPNDWVKAPVTTVAGRYSPLVGNWESFSEQQTLTGSYFQRYVFTFNADGTGSIETRTISRATDSPVGAPTKEPFRWLTAAGTFRVSIGENLYVYSITKVGTQTQLKLRAESGKSYTLFKN